MLDPAEAGGGCLRNLGPHGLDMFLYLTGEEAQVTGAQLSRRAHERPVEDYASVMLRSASGILVPSRSAMAFLVTALTVSGRSPAATPFSQ